MFNKLSSVAFVVATLAFSAMTVVAQDAPKEGECAHYYEVEGEACDEIARALNVSSYQLSFVNKLEDNCKSITLDEVCTAIVGEDCKDVHTVAEGETCGIIAGNKNISIDVLLENNPNVDPDCSSIRTDEVLCVAADVITYKTRDE